MGKSIRHLYVTQKEMHRLSIQYADACGYARHTLKWQDAYEESVLGFQTFNRFIFKWLNR